MKEYTHKETGDMVTADKISAIKLDVKTGDIDNGDRIIILEGGEKVEANHAFMRDHMATVGGYLFVNEDGRKRYKDAKDFEASFPVDQDQPDLRDQEDEDLDDDEE